GTLRRPPGPGRRPPRLPLFADQSRREVGHVSRTARRERGPSVLARERCDGSPGGARTSGAAPDRYVTRPNAPRCRIAARARALLPRPLPGRRRPPPAGIGSRVRARRPSSRQSIPLLARLPFHAAE